MPVLAGPRQARHLDPEDYARTSHRDLRDEPGKALPGIGRRRGHAEIVVDHRDPRASPAQRDRPLGQRVLQPRRLRVLKDLLPARLADVDDRSPVQVLRADLLLRLPLDPLPGQAHRDRLPSFPPRPWPPASPAARPPQTAVPAAAPPRPGDREPPFSGRSDASRSPAAADSSRRTTIAACNSAPTLSIGTGPGSRIETITALRVSAVAD